jgi:putative transposase
VDVTKGEFCCEKKGSRTMRKSQYSEEQIIGILREAEGETPVKVVCAKHNISDATFYKWRAKYGGMDVNEARRLRALEEENSRLKRAVADLTVQVQILKEVNSKKW